MHTRCDEDEDGCRKELGAAGLQDMESVSAVVECMVRCALPPVCCVLTFKNEPLIDSHIGICAC